ncbi:MAG: cytochrome c oxidase subunit II [Alphaproteobacteria bacterium]
MSKFYWKTGFLKMTGAIAVGIILALLQVSPALADGVPHAWGLGLQDPGTTIETRIFDFHSILLVIISAITILVLGLLIYVIVRYNKRANPEPSTTAHNMKLEVVWTLIPCLIVVCVALISFPLLYAMDRMPPPDLTLKVTGHQWYWSYEYPDNNKIAFDSVAIWNTPDVTQAQADASIKDAMPHWLIKDKPLRLLEVDNRVVLPVGKVIRVQITGSDVLHSWFVSSLGANRMAVPGRLNEIWFKIEKPGIYYGQCSMICGTGHGYMPIVIEGVTPEQFDAWVASKKTADNSGAATPKFSLAAAQ